MSYGTAARARMEDQRGARRATIRAAARRLFEARPVTKVSVEQIARESNLAVGSVYLHFHSKDDLLVSMLDDDSDELDVSEAQWAALLLLASGSHERVADDHLAAARQFVARLGAGALAAEFYRRLGAATK